MKNVRIVLTLMASVFFLSHCGNKDKAVTTIDWGGVECIAGVYEGEGDIRWSVTPFSPDQDLVVSIAFQGASVLVKVKGEDGDQLCTHYEGLEVTKVKVINEEDVSFLISATKVTNSRIEGTARSSRSLAQSLLDIQVNLADEDAPCSFKIGSQTPLKPFIGDDGKDEDSIESSQLKRQANQADYNVLIEGCGGIDTFFDPDILERKSTDEKGTTA